MPDLLTFRAIGRRLGGRLPTTATLVFLGGALTGGAAAQARTWSLSQAQEQAVVANLTLEQARAGVQQAAAQRLQTLSARLPSVDVSEHVVRTRDAVSAFGFGLEQERFDPATLATPGALVHPAAVTDYKTVLQVRQPLFNGGQEWHARHQATAAWQAAGARLQRTEAQVRLQTAEAYWGLVLARGALEAVRQACAAAEGHAAAAKAHYEQQSAPLSDLLAAQVRVAERRSQEIDATDRVAAAADGLTLATGLALTDEVVPTDSLVALAMSTPLESLLGAQLAGHGDLQAAAAAEKAAEHGVGVARAASMPHLNAFGQLDLDADEPFARQGESWTVGVAATWNLFSGLQSTGAKRQAQAQVRQARAGRELATAQLERQIAQAWRAVRSAQTQVELAGQAVAQADERLRMTHLQYQEEQVPSTDVLDAEAALTEARLRRLQALHDVNVGMARLTYAAGRPVE